jgi:hypothetical protein
VAPGVVLGSPDLGIDEAVDALVTQNLFGVSTLEPGTGLLRRPTFLQTGQDFGGESTVAFQTRSLPAPRFGALLRMSRPVANLLARVALQFASNRRWRAIQI